MYFAVIWVLWMNDPLLQSTVCWKVHLYDIQEQMRILNRIMLFSLLQWFANRFVAFAVDVSL